MCRMRTVKEIAREILTISASLDECEKSINKYESILSPEDIMGMYIEKCKRRLIELKQELNETN